MSRRPRPAQPAGSPPGTMRLDVALVARYAQLSRRRARAAIEGGQVRVDGVRVLEAGRFVRPEAALDWDVNRPARPRARCSLPLLYEGTEVVVVDKPPGLLSVPTRGARRDEEDSALVRVEAYAAHRKRRALAVHRLDRDTSGTLGFALDARTQAAVRRLFRSHDVERVYLALVTGVPREAEGTVDRAIALEYQTGRRRLARADEPSVTAITHWRRLEAFRDAALVELRLETGRQHQIRLHLAGLGHPILGDRVYGPARSPAGPSAPRQMLHAQRLGLRLPGSGERLRVESALPPDFERVLRGLRRRG